MLDSNAKVGLALESAVESALNAILERFTAKFQRQIPFGSESWFQCHIQRQIIMGRLSSVTAMQEVQ